MENNQSVLTTGNSSFLGLISGVRQSSVLDAIIFNISLSDLFLFIKKASLHDNILSAYSSDLNSLSDVLIEEPRPP